MPRPWAASSAWLICQGDPDRSIRGHGALLDECREVIALDQLEHEEGLTVDLFEPVNPRDAGVIQRGEKLGLALETGQPLGVACHLVGQAP